MKINFIETPGGFIKKQAFDEEFQELNSSNNADLYFWQDYINCPLKKYVCLPN